MKKLPFVPVTPEELAAIYMAGGRNSGEKSHAMEGHKYGNPESFVQFEREKKLKNVKKMKKRR